MRLLLIALFGMIFAAAPMLAAEAAERPGSRQQRVQARPVAHHAPVRQASVSHRRGVTRGAPQSLVQRSAPMRGQLGSARDLRAASAAGAICSSRRGRTHCAAPRMSWTRGLPPAAGTQANECPDGTMATLARGHDDITRCMPI